MFGDNFVHNCTRHFRTLFVHFINCEMSIVSNDAVHLLFQCVCDDRGLPWSLSIMNICSPIPEHSAPFSDTGRVHNMFAIACNKSPVNFTGSNFSACKNWNVPSTSQLAGFDIGAFIVTTRYTHNVKKFAAPTSLSTLYWTHQMTDLVQWNNCAGCVRKRSLLSEQPSYILNKALKESSIISKI